MLTTDVVLIIDPFHLLQDSFIKSNTEGTIADLLLKMQTAWLSFWTSGSSILIYDLKQACKYQFKAPHVHLGSAGHLSKRVQQQDSPSICIQYCFSFTVTPHCKNVASWDHCGCRAIFHWSPHCDEINLETNSIVSLIWIRSDLDKTPCWRCI